MIFKGLDEGWHGISGNWADLPVPADEPGSPGFVAKAMGPRYLEWIAGF